MTIKELENRTGMTRANIRFYEGEGLLTPKRLDNGYRDYSEEDVRTLEKIKLLRQLQLDIDAIRKVQRGTLTLEHVLFLQMNRLEGDRAVIERAAQVCRELQQTCVEYDALEPQPWLRQLEAPQRPGLAEPPVPPEDEAAEKWDGEFRACWHPWQRLFARTLDMTLYRAIFGWLWALLFWDQSFLLATGLLSWLLGLLLLAFTLAAEPLWLHFLGWTPGKLLFGLKLRDQDGDKLTIAQGWERSWRVFADGYAWNIPFWDLWKMWQCRKLGLDGRDCWWDAEEEYRYTKVERPFNTGVVYVILALACAGVLWTAKGLTDLPRNRGDLTVEEFAQNYNHYFKQLVTDRRYTGMPTLSKDGRWVEGENQSELIIGDWMNEGSSLWDDPVFTLEEGRVTAVTLHMESENETVFDLGTREMLTLLAMSGSVDGLNIFNYDLRGWSDACRDPMSLWEDLDFTYRGLHIAMQTEVEGYEPWGYGNLWTTYGESQHCEKTLTISLLEP